MYTHTHTHTLPEDAGVEAVVLQLSRSEPNGVVLFAQPMAGEDDGFLLVGTGGRGTRPREHKGKSHFG